jgi:hypothetical protein
MCLDRAPSCGWTCEICGDSIQGNAGDGQSAVHVDIDGIIDDVLTAFAAKSFLLKSQMELLLGRSQSISVNDVLNHPGPKSYVS